MKAEVRIGLSEDALGAKAVQLKKMLPIEDNLMVVTWLEDPLIQQKDFDVSCLSVMVYRKKYVSTAMRRFL